MKRSTLIIVLSAAFLSVGALGYYGLTKEPAQSAQPQGRGGAGALMGRGGPAGAGTLNTTAPTVRTIKASYDSLQPAITLFGQTQFARTFQVASPLSTTVENILVSSGEPVLAGQPLLQLDTRTVRRNLAQQNSQITEMQARIRQQVLQGDADVAALALEQESWQLAQDNLRRIQDLQARNLASAVDVESARRTLITQQQSLQNRELAVARQEDTLLQLNAQLDSLLRQQEALQEDLDAATIRAQADGLIDDILVQPGQTVSSGTQLLTLQSTEAFQIRATLPSQHLALLDRDNPLQGRIVWQGEPTVLALDSWGLNASQGGVAVILNLVDPKPPLIAGTFSDLNLLLPVVNNVLSVPTNALYGNNRIYEVADGRLVEHTAEIVGQDPERPSDAYVVRSSIAADADILVTRLDRPEAGFRVQVLNATQSAAERQRIAAERPAITVED